MKKKLIIIFISVFVVISISTFIGSKLSTKPVKEQPKTEKPTIVCIGDSITFGTGVLASRHDWAYPYLLDKKIEEYEVLNYGYSGATASNSGDQPYGQDLLDVAKEIEAEIYVVMLGTNDSKPQNWDAEVYKKDYMDMLAQLKALPTTKKVYVMSPICAFEKENTNLAVYDIDPTVIKEEIRPLVEEIAAELDIEYIDLYPLFVDKPELLKDGVHPGKDGNKAISDYIAQVITDDLQ